MVHKAKYKKEDIEADILISPFSEMLGWKDEKTGELTKAGKEAVRLISEGREEEVTTSLLRKKPFKRLRKKVKK